MDDTTRKVRMKIGDAEFEAEVPPDQVQPMYDRFLSMLADRALTKADEIGNGEEQQKPRIERRKLVEDNTVDDTLAARIFELRQDGIVALKVLPNGNDREADALLLLLFGYRRLKNEEHILATQLLRAAKYSGLTSVDRLDRGFGPYMTRYVIRGGQRKGSSYTANNQGLRKAEEIAAHMFD